MFRSILFGALLLIILVNGGGCSLDGAEKKANEQQVITIATGGTTGPYFAIANGIADIYNETLPFITTSIRSTGGGVDNIQLLTQRKVEMGLVMADIASFAYEGNKEIQGLENGSKLRAVAALYPNYVHLITLDPSLKDVGDLKGKKIGIGDIGSGTEINARTILKANGIDYSQIEEQYLSYRESVTELKNGGIDAAFLTSGLPNDMVLQLSGTNRVYFIPITDDAIYSVDSIPAGTYGNEKDIPTAVITNLLLTHRDLPDELVFQMTKAIFDNIEQLQSVHPAAEHIQLSSSQQGLTVPLHPGAEKYYRQLGILH